MKPEIALKMLYRSPVRTVLIFILIAAVTFALFSQVMGYVLTERELKSAVNQYRGVGVVERSALSPEARRTEAPYYIYTDDRVSTAFLTEDMAERFGSMGYAKITQNEIDKILGFPYISYGDTRYMTAGVMPSTLTADYIRLDEGEYYYNYTNSCVVEGTVTSIEGTRLTVETPVLLAGTVYFRNKIYIELETEVAENNEDGRTLVWSGTAPRATTFSTSKSKYTAENIDAFKIGNRYAFILRYDAEYAEKQNYPIFCLTDPFAYGWCDAVWDVTEERGDYLNSERFAPLEQYCSLVNTDNYTYDVVYTKDMESILYFADGTMTITTGRGLSCEDYEEKARVCVVHNDFANRYNLKIGDEITVKLGDTLFEQSKAIGAVAVVPERLSDNYTLVTLEIVGKFDDSRHEELQMSDANRSYSRSTVFVPGSLLNVPESELEGHEFTPGEFSFVVENAWEIPAFLEEVAPLFAEMGLKLTFEDGGWQEKISAFQDAQRISMIKIIILSASVILSVVLTAYMFILGKRRDFAIMRSMGVPKKLAVRTLLLQIGFITATAVIVGTVVAVVYTTKSTAASDALGVLGRRAVKTDILPAVTAACVLSELIVIFAVSSVMLVFLGKLPPLELLQASAKRVKTKQVVEETVPVVYTGDWVSIDRPVRDENPRRAKFVTRYVWRHIKRTSKKCLLSILITVLMLSVLCRIGVMNEHYTYLYENTSLKASFSESLNIYNLDVLLKSGYVKDVYYTGRRTLDVDNISTVAYITNNISRSIDEDVQINFLNGYDNSAFNELSNVVVMGQTIMNERGYNLGDMVELSAKGYFAFANYCVRFVESVYYRNGYSEKEIQEAILDKYEKRTAKFTIVGAVTSENSTADYAIFLPGTTEASPDYGKYVVLKYADASLADNDKAEEFREFGAGISGATMSGDVSFALDETEKAKHLKNNAELLGLMFPVASVAFAAVGVFVCCLFISQLSKETAVMRVLGTSKRRIRAIMVAEQMILCVVGIILSCIIMLVGKTSYNVTLLMIQIFSIYAFVILLASIIASAAATSKNVLELLQTRE
ncbi:MAG: hypothetical protein IJ017_08360 [Oscillospiraceae bacterium]|nr:hypothetical protein [Oscillospiraceae bacterium]